MGSYSDLYVNGFSIFSLKNGCDSKLINSIFRLTDLVYEMRTDISQEEEIKFCALRNIAKICRERLEIYGVSRKSAELDFSQTIEINKEEGIYNLFTDFSISYNEYLGIIKHIIEKRALPPDEPKYEDFKEYLIDNELYIDNQSVSCWLWSILSICQDEAIVEYNLTDVVNNGWVDIENFSWDLIEKIIILTEGKTDIEFIKSSLQIFFPHLVDYYHFMDFENSRVEGNVSRLVHTIKSFIGAGIKNPLIALFDNDSAAKEELLNLRNIKLPQNIRVLCYPDIDLANEYPTIGPTGEQKLNVNGLAGSIELYLGKDVLTINNKLTPILWSGFKSGIRKYQGELEYKSELQNRFREKLKSYKGENYNIDHWREMLSILNLIKNAWK